MKPLLLLVLFSVLSFSAVAGKITIEKSDSLIRNDLFNEKEARAAEYKKREAERNESNNRWSSEIPPSCGLLKNSYLIYFCASSGRYYKGYESGELYEYRELSSSEVKKIHNAKD